MLNHHHEAGHTTPDPDPDEAGRQFVHHAIELALSLGDFQKEVNQQYDPLMIVSEAAARIEKLIEFDATGIYLVDEESADLKLANCRPNDARQTIESEMSILIDNGTVAWAMRERRGIALYSADGHRQLFLHVMATCSRIRGMFIGIFPPRKHRLPDASLEILSIILRNAANGIESIVYSRLMKRRNGELQRSIEEKTQHIVGYEKQLLQTQNTQAIAKLAGGIAHHFNNALTSLIGYLDLMAISNDDPTKILSYIERVHPIAERMGYLTKNLLAYSHGGNLTTRMVTLKEIFQEAMPTIKRAVKDSATLSLELAEGPIWVQADMIQMRMAILAIIENANEAIADNGVISIQANAVTGCSLAGAPNSGKFLYIRIQDNGPGMDPDTLRRIFEPFFSTKFEGRGLSMAAASSFIKNHNGWIGVDSKLGKGTRVNIYLPAVTPEEA